jgi:peptidoglycan-N-acetylglucosamine deacetylase
VSAVVSRLHELPGDRFAPDEPVVALTFDDGPGPATPEIADTLARMEVPATFFVVGSAAAGRPDEVKRLAADGHTIGGHSCSHPRSADVDDAQVVDECVRTAALVAELTGAPAPFVRPPYRKVDGARYAALLDDLGFATVTWSLDPRDWAATDPVDIVTAVLDALKPGAIVVLHDGGRNREATVEALPLIVHGARLAGYRFVAL